MNYKRLLILLLLFLTVLSALFGSGTDYRILEMNLDVTVGKDAVHSINEDYLFLYGGPHHGFVRDIPVDYSTADKSHKVKVKNIRCTDPYSTETEDGYLSLRIGSEDKSYTGEKAYSLSYTYDIGADRNQGYDEFYFNILGSYWECPIDKVSFKITVPCSYSDTLGYIFLTRGYYGATQEEEPVITQTDDGLVISGELYNFEPQESLTLRVQLPENWYENARLPMDKRALFKVLAPVISLICVFVCFLIWYFFGRDSIPIITARFEPPEGFSPLVEGFLADERVDDKDITSMLYYWADKGLITISEEKKNEFVFNKIGEMPLDAPDFERELFYKFFKFSDSVTTQTLKESDFFTAMQECKLKVAAYFTKTKKLKDPKSLVLAGISFVLSLIPFPVTACASCLMEGKEGIVVAMGVIGFVLSLIMTFGFAALFSKWYVRKNKGIAVVLSLIPVAIAFVVSYLFCFLSHLGKVYFIVCAVCFSLCSFLSSITQKRSKYGTEILEGTLGFREFIEKVQISELVTMIDTDPMLYYHVLSYAIVFGLEDKWAKKFASVAVPPPVWYTGSRTFDYLYFSRMASRMNVCVKTAVTQAVLQKQAPGKVLSGSSFGFHGFSGGGFGGGGGHAW